MNAKLVTVMPRKKLKPRGLDGRERKRSLRFCMKAATEGAGALLDVEAAADAWHVRPTDIFSNVSPGSFHNLRNSGQQKGRPQCAKLSRRCFILPIAPGNLASKRKCRRRAWRDLLLDL